MITHTLPIPRREYPCSFLLVEEAEEEPKGFTLNLTYVLHLNLMHYIQVTEILSVRMLALANRGGIDLLTIIRRQLHGICENKIKQSEVRKDMDTK